MVSDDLGFLLIFIVLPTVLIVSGLWMVLFIRRDFSSRTSVQPRPGVEDGAGADARSSEEFWANARQEAEAQRALEEEGIGADLPLVIATLPEPVAATTEPEVIATFEPESGEALTGAGALSAALLNDPETRAQMLDQAGTPQPAADAEVMRGHTEQIDPVDAEVNPEPATSPANDPVEVPEAPEPIALDVTIPSGSTAPLPEPVEVEAGADLDDDEEADDDQDGPDAAEGRRRRQPDARLTRSTENVRRRGRGGRRVPPIVRPALRDEDAVERDDGG